MRAVSMYNDLYGYLEGFEQSDENEIFKQIVNEWSEDCLNDFVVNVFQLIHNDYFESKSYYNFYANSTLSGAPFPCSAFECRANNISELSRFAALYADKVLVLSPIDKYYEDVEAGRKINRVDLVEDILVLFLLKPLVMTGIIGFFSSYICLCQNCMKKITKSENELQIKMNKISEIIHKEASEKIRCSLQRDDKGIAYFSINGAEKLGFHTQVDVLINKENKIIKKLLRKSRQVIITTEMMDKFGIMDYLFEPLVNDVFQAQINTTFTDSSYMTNRLYDSVMITELQTMGVSKESIDNTRLIQRGLFHKIPLLGEVQIEDIVRLRKKDGEAFDGYRSNMNAVLDQYDKIDRKAINDIQRDIIIPELDIMEQTIYRNKRALIKSSAQDIILLGGGIGIGIFSGMIPIDYSAVVGAVGGISAISNISDKARRVFSNDEIKSNRFYFLYELQSQYKKVGKK